MVRTLGVIVAGGLGRRLGAGSPKALVRLGGSTLLERAEDTLGQACDEVVVTAPPTVRLAGTRCRLVDDLPFASGPLSGAVAGFEAVPHERVVLLAVDLPLLAPTFLRVLLERLEGRSAVLPAPHGVPQPLAAVYTSTASTEMARRLRAGERSITTAALALNPLLLGDDAIARLDGGAAGLLNVNTPEDLVRAERLLAFQAGREDVA